MAGYFDRTSKKIDTWEFVPDGHKHDISKRVVADVFMERSKARVQDVQPIKVYANVKTHDGVTQWTTDKYASLEDLHEFLRRNVMESANYKWEKVLVMAVTGTRSNWNAHVKNELNIDYIIQWRTQVGDKTYYVDNERAPNDARNTSPFFMYEYPGHAIKYGNEDGVQVYPWTMELEDSVLEIMAKIDLLRHGLNSLNLQSRLPSVGKSDCLSLPLQ